MVISPSAIVDLIFFEGCPHVEAARANVRAALAGVGLPPVWVERNQSDPGLASEWRRFPSPTVLVNGIDVAGAGAGGGSACRAAGAPPADLIAAAIRRA